MEKVEPDSMATVQMKSDYAASEVYSTAGSEAPPAYIRRQSSSVQIAKIIALAVIVSSFIIGSFILASTYLQARASCDQMQTLDSVLEKELMLETLQQELPKAEALLQGREMNENNLQNLDKDVNTKKDDKKESDSESDSSDSESDSSFSDSDESGELNRVHIKLPLELDLSDLASAILENNQKSRMNCVVERRRAEELVDSPPKTMQLPFGVNLTTDQKKQRVTGERLAIFCESGSEPSQFRNVEQQAEEIHPFVMPVQRMPIPYGPIPQQNPLTHMPQQQMPPQYQPQYHQQPQQFGPPPQFMRQMPPPSQQQQAAQQLFHHLQQEQQQQQQQQQQRRPMIPDQFMQAPRPEQPQEVRIQLQRIPLRGEMSEPAQVQIHEIPSMDMTNGPQQNGDMMPPQQRVQIQRIPLAVALQRAGITPDDLRNIQRMAEERIQQEFRQLAAEDQNVSAHSNMSPADSSADSSSDEDDSSSVSSSSSSANSEQTPQIMQIGRIGYGRSLMTPIQIPVNMMQQDVQQEPAPADRPHFVQPRSVRSVDSVLKGENRVKRFNCDCKC